MELQEFFAKFDGSNGKEGPSRASVLSDTSEKPTGSKGRLFEIPPVSQTEGGRYVKGDNQRTTG